MAVGEGCDYFSTLADIDMGLADLAREFFQPPPQPIPPTYTTADLAQPPPTGFSEYGRRLWVELGVINDAIASGQWTEADAARLRTLSAELALDPGNRRSRRRRRGPR